MKQTSGNPCAKPDPAKDGIDHINIHSRGKTELGQKLAQASHSPFIHPYYGPFHCVEGFLCYIKGGGEDSSLDAFRNMTAVRARARVRKGIKDGSYVNHSIPNLDKIIMAANYAKIDQNPAIKQALIESVLPFQHYYLFGEGNVLISPKGSSWLIRDITELRNMFIEGRTLDDSAFRPPSV